VLDDETKIKNAGLEIQMRVLENKIDLRFLLTAPDNVSALGLFSLGNMRCRFRMNGLP
jgi:hypothetical protein